MPNYLPLPPDLETLIEKRESAERRLLDQHAEEQKQAEDDRREAVDRRETERRSGGT